MSNKIYKVINPGLNYSAILRNEKYKRDLDYDEDNMVWIDGASLESGEEVEIISETQHEWQRHDICLVKAKDSAQHYVIAKAALAEVNNEEEHISKKITENLSSKKRRPQMPKSKLKDISVGDVCIITRQDNLGKLFKVTACNSAGYDFIGTLDLNSSIPTHGFYIDDLMKLEQTPVDDRIKYTAEELFDILNQDKPAEEVLMDLRDHLTN